MFRTLKSRFPGRCQWVSSLIVPLICCSLAGIGSAAASEGESAMTGDTWAEVDRLIAEQRFESAAEQAATIRVAAREHGDDEQLTRALIKETQLRTGLHGTETAVRFLRDQEWPETPRSRLILGLFYGRSLVNYLRSYHYEIEQRETVSSGEELDLKLWTSEQIRREIHRTYAEVWRRRDSWGGESIGDLAEYIDQNDYPARIRGSLRDAVTYLWVDLLADRMFWGPRDTNELYRLDLGALLSDAGDVDSELLPVDDPKVHPLLKVRRLLTDLERWHSKRSEPEAAFEARLTLIRQLKSSFNRDSEQAVIRADLETRLDRLGRRLPWWSMGQSVLAGHVRNMNLPDALVQARGLALAGAEAHPDTLGGQTCRQIVTSIDQKSFQLAGMAVDGPDRRSLEITHTNLEQIYFRAYPFRMEGRVVGAKSRRIAPDYNEVEALVRGGKPLLEWRVDLPKTTDHRSHRTFDTPPLTENGAYVIVGSARSDFALQRNQLAAVFFQISDIVLWLGEPSSNSAEKRSVDNGSVWWAEARSGRTGDPLSDVELTLYRLRWREGHEVVGTVRTSADGFAVVDPAALETASPTSHKTDGKGRRHRQHQYLLAARLGSDQVFHPNTLFAGQYRSPSSQVSTLTYTDRSIYRPGQEIMWKVVAYEQSADSRQFEVLKKRALSVELRDANGESVAKMDTTTNDIGSASGRFTIPEGRLLGRWRLQPSIGPATTVNVEEYKRPSFKVEIDEPSEPARLNRETVLTGRAAYYFGLPLQDAEVRWRVTREPVYYPYFFWRRAPNYESRVIAQGESRLDAEGHFEVRFTPKADERLSKDERHAVHYRYRLKAEVTEAGGETRNGDRSFQVGFVAVDAHLDAERKFFVDDAPVELSIRRSHLDGTPLAGRGTWSLLRLVQPETVPLPADLRRRDERRDGEKTAGDLLRPRWDWSYSPERVLADWQAGEEVASGNLEHGVDGIARVSTDARPGAYRLIYRTEDAFGAELERSKELLVVGERGFGLALPALLLAEQDRVDVDAAARFLVHSGLAGQHMDLRLFRHGRETERLNWISTGEPMIIDVAVEDGDRGGISATLAMVRDHQAIRLSEGLDVPWDNRELSLELATFRDVLRPGGRETWRVTLKSKSGHDLHRESAELLAYMFDKSLELFGEHVPPDIARFLPNRPAEMGLSHNLSQAPTVWQRSEGWFSRPSVRHYRGDQLKFYDSYGIGGPGSRGGRMMRNRGHAAMAMRSMPPAPMAAAKAAPAGRAEAAEMEVFTASLDADVVADEAVSRAADGGSPPIDEGPELRENFSETAFWHPHLLLDDDGGATFEFTVPDSVTEWDVWIHAFTRGLRSASLRESVRTVKDLLIRPYLPRFFREGDRAELRVVVSNAGDTTLSGTLDFDIYDPETEKDLLYRFGLGTDQAHDVPYTVEPGSTATLRFPVQAPKEPGAVAVRVQGRAGDHSDGELRPLPVLPSRLYLSQSRFASLDGPGERVLEFEDLARDDDPTLDHESLIVTLDAQLFYSVLSSLPYLVSYPYECTEQTLNRFVSTGILSSLFDRYPAVGKMAASVADSRDTPLKPWVGDDPNRRMLLEESPWLRASRGGETPENAELLKVLDPEIADAQRRKALAELAEVQLPDGGFPWWSGGPPSPFITLNVLEGLSRALEYEVEVPRDMVLKAWTWVADWWRRTQRSKLKDKDLCCPESTTYLTWILTRYPDVSWTGGVFTEDDVDMMVDYSWRHWKRHSPRLKGYLALVLLARDRSEDASKIWESVMDSAKTDQRLGTYWTPEDRAWLWYNDTVETHAFALRVLTELAPEDPRRAGLVQWLLLDKKLGHWKSTRATAEAIYALVKYIEAEGSLGTEEDATVKLGKRRQHFVFKPDAYTGANNQVIVDGADVTPKMSKVVVEKTTPGTLFASATWHFATDRLPDKGDGDLFWVERRFFRRSLVEEEWVLEPLEEGARLEVGDQLEVRLAIKAEHAAEFVHLRDPRGAGFEPEDTTSGYRWDLGVGHYREIRDSGTNFFFDWLPAGDYTFSYRVRAATAGMFRVGPSTLQSMYAPEMVAYSSGDEIRITGNSVDD